MFYNFKKIGDLAKKVQEMGLLIYQIYYNKYPKMNYLNCKK